MRRATSGASIGPLSKQLTPILSVAAHEGPYAFKFKGSHVVARKNAASEIARGLPAHRHPAPHLRCPRGRRRRATAGRKRAKRAGGRRFRCRCFEIRPTDVTAAKPPALIARNARQHDEPPHTQSSHKKRAAR